MKNYERMVLVNIILIIIYLWLDSTAWTGLNAISGLRCSWGIFTISFETYDASGHFGSASGLNITLIWFLVTIAVNQWNLARFKEA